MVIEQPFFRSPPKPEHGIKRVRDLLERNIIVRHGRGKSRGNRNLESRRGSDESTDGRRLSVRPCSAPPDPESKLTCGSGCHSSTPEYRESRGHPGSENSAPTLLVHLPSDAADLRKHLLALTYLLR